MTRLGIKSNVLAALICIVGAVSGYVGALLIAGYVLLMEQDQMLRRVSVKTLVVMCAVSLGHIIVNLLPDTINVISNMLGIFGGSLYIGFLANFCSMLKNAISLAEIVILTIMAIQAFAGKEFKFTLIDNLVDKCMPVSNNNTYAPSQPTQQNVYQNENPNPYQNQTNDNNDITFG